MSSVGKRPNNNDISLSESFLTVPTYKRRRVTRQTYGTVADIPIVLDSSTSESNTSESDDDDTEVVFERGLTNKVKSAKNITTYSKNDVEINNHSNNNNTIEKINSPITNRKTSLKPSANIINKETLDLDKVLETSKQIQKEKRESLKNNNNNKIEFAAAPAPPATAPAPAPPATATATATAPPATATAPTKEVKITKLKVTENNKNELKPNSDTVVKSAFAFFNEKLSDSDNLIKISEKVELTKFLENPKLKNLSEKRISENNNVSSSTPPPTSNHINHIKKNVVASSSASPANNPLYNTIKVNMNITNRIIEFDPTTQKSYKDTYSVCCISCQKKGRSEYCNRQKPCDICVGKRLKNCTYPSDAKIAIPGKKSSRLKSNHSKQYKDDGIKNANNLYNDFRVDTKRSENREKKPKAVKDSDDTDNENANLFNLLSFSDSDSDSENVAQKSEKNGIPTSIAAKSHSKPKHVSKSKSKNADSKKRNHKLSNFIDYDDNEDDDEEKEDNADFEKDSDDSGSDFSDDNDQEDDAYEKSYRRRQRKSKSKADDFEKAQRLLRELEFEKRDVNEIYASSGRKRRNATRENYYIPSDLEDESDSNDGYAAAEARNEQVILSEDEQERRMLRGEIGLDYIESLRTEREKYNHQASSDSLSSSDEE